ncbi:MAG: hypothetical protein ACREWI_15930 [Telluria sp.]
MFKNIVTLYLAAIVSGHAMERPASPEEQVITIQISQDLWKIVKVGDKYVAMPTRETNREIVRNAVTLDHHEMIKLKGCLSQAICPRLDVSSLSRSDPEEKVLLPEQRVIRRLSHDILVVQNGISQKFGWLINGATGEIYLGESAQANTIDVRTKRVYYVICKPEKNECSIYDWNLKKNSEKILTTVPYHIDDIAFVRGTLIVVARNVRPRRGIVASIFAAAGHPPSLNNWVLLEVSREGKYTAHPLLNDTSDGHGRIVNKWAVPDM